MPKTFHHGFVIHQSKGFHITFANGCTVSVQFGCGNYAESNQSDPFDQPEGGVRSPTAEIAAWDSQDNWLHPEGFDFADDDVLGWQTPEDVARFIQAIKEWPNAPCT